MSKLSSPLSGLGKRSAQREIEAENINEFVSLTIGGGRVKQHTEHTKLRKYEQKIGLFMKNPQKNRFSNGVLYNQGAVALRRDQKNDEDYIHATRVNTHWGSYIMTQAGRQSQWRLFSFQAPMPSTLVDFLRLVWQEKVHTIVCLVEVDDVANCAQYFDKKQKGRFIVKTISIRNDGPLITSYELRLKNLTEKEKENCKRRVNVIALSGWSPDKVYDHRNVIQAIHNTEAFSTASSVEFPKDAPLLIHGCSGIRRTGVFTLACIFSRQISGRRRLGFMDTVTHLRCLRYGVMRQKHLYLFLLEVIVALIAESGALVPASQEYQSILNTIREMYPKSRVPGENEYDEEQREEEGGQEEDKDKSKKKTSKSKSIKFTSKEKATNSIKRTSREKSIYKSTMKDPSSRTKKMSKEKIEKQ